MADFPAPATTAVLLAAGAGTRLGRGPKALLPFRGRTLVEVLADVLSDGGCREVVVVLGAGAQAVRASTDLHRHAVVENPAWPSGMGSSLRLGLASARPGNHVLVALVDQPGLTPETVQAFGTGAPARAGHRRRLPRRRTVNSGAGIRCSSTPRCAQMLRTRRRATPARGTSSRPTPN